MVISNVQMVFDEILSIASGLDYYGHLTCPKRISTISKDRVETCGL